MYKREVFESLGGFVNHTIFNEDMITLKKQNVRLKEGIENSLEVDLPVNGNAQEAINNANQNPRILS